MSWTVFRERGGDETQKLKEAVMMIKEGSEIICELAEQMQSEYGERGSYGQRGGYGERGAYGNYSNRDGYSERYGERGRDSMGRFR